MPACTDSCCRPEPGITYEVLSRRAITATRKTHVCVTCRAEIPAGSACQRVAVLGDGKFYCDYQHHPYDPACGINPVPYL